MARAVASVAPIRIFVCPLPIISILLGLRPPRAVDVRRGHEGGQVGAKARSSEARFVAACGPGSVACGGDEVEFRMLGPLEVVVGGEPIDLGGPKQRAVLALLLIEANRVVPSE